MSSSIERRHALSNKILDLVNEEKGVTLGDKVDALAYASAWLLLNIGGVNKFEKLGVRFMARMQSVALHVDREQLEICEANAAYVEAQISDKH